MSKIKIYSGTHVLLNPGCVVWITAGDDTADSIFTVTWNMPARREPGMVAILCGQNHHTYQYIRKTGAFAINIPEAKMVDAVLGCGVISGSTGVDKFEKFGLTREKAEKINAPLVEEAFANIECQISQVVDMGAGALLLAQVVSSQVDERHFKDGQLTFENGLELLHHMSGNRFCVSRELLLGNME